MGSEYWAGEDDDDDVRYVDPDTLPSPSTEEDEDFETDFVRNDTKEISRVLAWHRQSLSNLADMLKANFDLVEEKHCVIHNLVTRSASELNRLAHSLHEPIEMTAWSARNLFELNLVVRYLLQSDRHVQRWVAEQYRDEVDLLKGILSLHPTHPDMTDLTNRLNAVREKVANVVPEASKGWPNTADIARAVGRHAEYKAFYKLYSKYVHPTSWFVNTVRTAPETWLHRGIFLVQGRRHAEWTYEAVRQSYEFYEDEEGLYLM